MNAKELRIEADELQLQVQKLVNNFVEKSGYCAINISVENKSIIITGSKSFLSSDVKVTITV